MFGQTTTGRGTNSPSATRTFRIEVTGMRQNPETDRTGYAIRKSGSTFITVPYSRMNEQVRRITRMGGTIVKIEPLTAASALEPANTEAAAAPAESNE